MTAAVAPRIHPTAVVDPKAELGGEVEIGPYCVVEAGAVLGDRVVLGPAVHVFCCVRIGAGTSVRTGSVLGGEPQDLKYGGDDTRVVIGERCRFHEHVTIHRGTGAGTETVVGDEVMLMAGAHIGHNCRVGRNVVMVNGSMLAGHVEVGERAFLSGGSGVHQFCRVGRLTLVAGMCTVTRDAPPFSIVAHNYPTRWRAPNTIGLRRAGFTPDQRTAIRHALSRCFRSGEPRGEVARELARSAVPEVAEIARFLLDSKRGVCAGPPSRPSRDEGESGF